MLFSTITVLAYHDAMHIWSDVINTFDHDRITTLKNNTMMLFCAMIIFKDGQFSLQNR